MQNGTNNIIDRAERAIKQMAGCGLSYSAKDIKTLIQYTKALDKNQKALIRLMLKYKRENKTYEHLVKHMVKTINTELKYIEDIWTSKEGEEE